MEPGDQAVGQFAPSEMKIDEGYVRSVLGEQTLGLRNATKRTLRIGYPGGRSATAIRRSTSACSMRS